MKRAPAKPARPAAPSSWPRRALAGIARWARYLAVALPLISILQVGLVGLVTPPLTWTMVDRALEHHARAGRWRWVDYRPIDAREQGASLARAAVASEDARFWLHHGFDLEGICTALGKNQAAGEPVAGGSTITQQVARNVFLWQERSWLRKGLEAWYTLWLELLLSKERILELYLNVAETGPMTFGVEAGARLHFGARARALSPEQAARLVSILPSPRRWSPDGETARARAARTLAHPAIFPGDPGWSELRQKWERGPWIPTACRRALRWG